MAINYYYTFFVQSTNSVYKIIILDFNQLELTHSTELIIYAQYHSDKSNIIYIQISQLGKVFIKKL